MTRQPRIGLLPLYLELYDKTMPEVRAGFGPLRAAVEKGLAARGAEVVAADVCRRANEVRAAVALFRKKDVDCVVTYHLAYSPSLESAPVLARTAWPLILLDTSPDARFGRATDPARIMYNHGVHGVMDLASVLRRLGRPFEIVAGHLAGSDALARVIGLARAAVAARQFRGARALRVGPTFRGMGDFAVEAGVLRHRFGIGVTQADAAALGRAMRAVAPAAIRDEMANDRRHYAVRIDPDLHRRTVHAGLGLRRLLEAGNYAACSVNFQAFSKPGDPPMPFAEISKAMARGVGYGGEGDVLTACLVGALARGFGDTTFTEIFCSDWAGDSLFLSHMGEINPELAAARPALVERAYAFLGTGTAALVCGIRPGSAVFVNLVPGPEERFDLILAPVKMLADATRADMRKGVRGWMRPRLPVAEFLEAYSRLGGTHHSALVMGGDIRALAAFGRFAGFGVQIL